MFIGGKDDGNDDGNDSVSQVQSVECAVTFEPTPLSRRIGSKLLDFQNLFCLSVWQKLIKENR